MIPYLEVPALTVGSYITIQPFGLLVVTGCIMGIVVARWHALSLGLPVADFGWLAVWVLIPAFVLSHLTNMVLYYPELILHEPTKLLKFETSMSSFGGFLGGSIGAIVYLKRHSLAILEYGDALVLGLAIGWLFGRLGCTIVHDHPGIHSEFFLAVNYPDGPRHDLGLYEWLFTIVLCGILLLVRAKQWPAGTITGVACVVYAPVRFMFDFLRVGEKLYFGFTPGQYFAALLLFLGIWVLLLSIDRLSGSGEA